MLTTVLLTLYTIFAIGISLRILFRELPVGDTLSWLLVVYAIPVGGAVAYLLLGENRIGYKRKQQKKQLLKVYNNWLEKHLNLAPAPDSGTMPLLQELGTKLTRAGAYANNHLTLLDTPDEIFEQLLKDIREAKDYCFFGFYIIETGGRMQTLLELLEQKARAGVTILILPDAIGSSGFLRSPEAKRLIDAGAEIRRSLPINILKAFFVRADLRNHRKIICIDDYVAYTGSFNLVDPKAFKQDEGVGEWIDVMVRCQGAIYHDLLRIFCTDWLLEGDESDRQALDEWLNLHEMHSEDCFHKQEFNTVHTVPSGPDQNTTHIYEMLIYALSIATEEVIITTPYFVPDEMLLFTILSAANRGVDVHLILPEKNDSSLVHYTTHSFYRVMLEAGVHIHEYQKGLLHTKSVVLDREVTFIGTANMDIRSFYLNFEVTLVVYNKVFSQKVYQLQQRYISNSQQVCSDEWANRSTFRRIKESFLRLTRPLL